MLGRTHPVVRRALALRREPRTREVEGAFLAEGIHLAQEALAAEADVETAIVSEALGATAEGKALLARLHALRIRVEEVAERTLDALQDARSPQPILLVVRRPVVSVDAALDARPGVPLVVVACAVQDPGNLGSILRTADAAGATALLAAQGADLLHSRTVRATMGSIFRLPCAKCEIELAIATLAKRGMRLLATSPAHGERYDRADLRGPIALFLGGEGPGLAAEIAARMDGALRIPMREGVESLSVGAAAAVVLYEVARQRGAP